MPTWINDPELTKNWMGPWSGLYHCATCGALISGNKCLVCGWELLHEEIKFIDKNGVERTVPRSIVAGAIPYTTHLFLGMMQRKWERPLHADHWMDQKPGGPPQISPCFWPDNFLGGGQFGY
ncbi:hypothetical protein [Ferrovibrio sp.]|uniref:hypothetical protein n=1 Tax=Ferrovibrio sp. TaxID=1917215 RepID=UPI0035B26DCF